MSFEEFDALLGAHASYQAIRERETRVFLHEYWVNKLKEK